MNKWEELARYCEDTYGSYIDWEERFFICPECGEPIYECDWATEIAFLSGNCPICEINLYTLEYEEEEEE